MANLRLALAVAIPALVTTVIGLFWIFIRKRDDDPDTDAGETMRKTQRSNDNILPNTDDGHCMYVEHAEQNVLRDQKTVESNCEPMMSKATINVLDQRDVTVDDQGIAELNKNGNANNSYLEANSSCIDSLAQDISEKVVASAIVQHCNENNAEALSCVTDSGITKQSLLRDDDISGTVVELNHSTHVISNSDSGIGMPSSDTHAPKDTTTSHEFKELKIDEDNTSSHEDSTTNAPTLSWSELSACENDDASNLCNGLHDDPDTAVYWDVMMEQSNNSLSQNHPSNHRKTILEDIGSVDESIIASGISNSCSSMPSVFYDSHVQNNSESLSVSHAVNSCNDSENGTARELRSPAEHSAIGSEASSCDNNSEVCS